MPLHYRFSSLFVVLIQMLFSGSGSIFRRFLVIDILAVCTRDNAIDPILFARPKGYSPYCTQNIPLDCIISLLIDPNTKETHYRPICFLHDANSITLVPSNFAYIFLINNYINYIFLYFYFCTSLSTSLKIVNRTKFF